MRKFSKFTIFLFIYSFASGFGNCTSVFAQVNIDSLNLEDDPIAAALDSMYHLDWFEKGYAEISYHNNSKYHFSVDSVPRYDEMVYEARLSKLNAASPFDLQYNKYVQGYIDLYATRKRELVSRMMALSKFYFPLFEASLDKYNLPLEFKYLAICESALNPLARSRSGAVGLWQFMYPTGKMFGLKITSYVDERSDPYKSTIAACEYFQYLYKMFGDWELVLAAYNGGPGTLSRAIRRSGGQKNYWKVRPYLPRETQGYVPAFIAVNYIMNHTNEHNIKTALPKRLFFEVDTVVVKKQLSFHQISSILDITEDELEFLNPSYRKKVIPVSPGQTSILILPISKMGLFVNNEDKIYNYISKEVLAAQSVVIKPKAVETYIVRSGDNLNLIARRMGCTVENLKKWNNINSNTIHPGNRLIVYNSYVNNSSHGSNNKTTATSGNYQYHTIKKGDSLYKIAIIYHTTIQELCRLNNFSVNYNLLPGKKVRVRIL